MWKRDAYEKQVQRLVPEKSLGVPVGWHESVQGRPWMPTSVAKLLQPRQKEHTHSLVVVGSETSTCGCLRPSWGCDGKSRPSTNPVVLGSGESQGRESQVKEHTGAAGQRGSHPTQQTWTQWVRKPTSSYRRGSVGPLCTYQEPFRHFLVWQKRVVVFGHRDVLGIRESCLFACLLFKIRKYVFFSITVDILIY